jgi:hypothetical protein
LSSGNRGSAGHRDAGRAERAGGVRDRAAGRHQIVNDHDPAGGSAERHRSRRIRLELAGGGQPSLGGGQRRGVRSGGVDPEHGRDPRADPGAGENADGARRQALDVLATAPPGHRRGRGHRHQPDLRGPVEQRLDRGGERRCQRAGEIPTAALLVSEQAGSGRSSVRRGHGQRRKALGNGVGAVPPRLAQGLQAPRAHGSAGIGASGASARQGQVGQHGDHAATVPLPGHPQKIRSGICGQRSGLWTTS